MENLLDFITIFAGFGKIIAISCGGFNIFSLTLHFGNVD
jgi:hypothetical protein